MIGFCGPAFRLTLAADAEAVRKAVATVIEAKYRIAHATIQTERDACEDSDHLHP